mgnify:CR=1 FL=1
MDADVKIKSGWVTLAAAVAITFLIMIIMDPDQDAIDDCESELAESGDSRHSDYCQDVVETGDAVDIMMAFGCCLPTVGAVVMLGLGYNERNQKGVTTVIQAPATVIQSPAYMMPAQPTYAPPVVHQPTQSELDAQLKMQRIQNVELLRSEGRLMEAALEAEQAGEYSMAGELRTLAEEQLRSSHMPKSNNEDTYLAFLTTALADGFLSQEEENLLEIQRNNLGVSWDVHNSMLATAGYSHEMLKLLQNAKTMEDSGRFLESASLYEAAGNLDKAQMLRMKASMFDNKPSSVTYNISDSAVGGNIGLNNNDDNL